MVSGSQGSAQKKRADRERARVYEARARVHEERQTRRRRDSIIAGVVGGVVVIGAIVGQALYFSVGPGVPEPAATASPTPAATTTDVVPDTAETPATGETEPAATPEASPAE